MDKIEIQNIVTEITKKATISKIERVDGKNTDLKIDNPVYAIHFKLEEQKCQYPTFSK